MPRKPIGTVVALTTHVVSPGETLGGRKISNRSGTGQTPSQSSEGVFYLPPISPRSTVGFSYGKPCGRTPFTAKLRNAG
jgi:hypothetical protein